MAIFKRRYAATQRTINGKRYSLWATVSYKKMAESIANDVRKEGHLASVAKAPDGWSVYKFWRKPSAK